MCRHAGVKQLVGTELEDCADRRVESRGLTPSTGSDHKIKHAASAERAVRQLRREGCVGARYPSFAE
jgi:hypothetical protein